LTRFSPRLSTLRSFLRHSGVRSLFGILIGLAAVSAVLVAGDVDRIVAAAVYDPALGWPAGDRPLWQWLYRYGTVPGVVLTLGALVGFGLSFTGAWLRRWRRELILVFLTAAIGGGVLVNAFFKPYWGRPRPRQVEEFGGLHGYREFYRPDVPGKGQSFPCGHCTMGFVFVSLVFLRRRAPAAALAGTVFGLAYGSLLGLCRILQGGHFVTDVLWSLGILLLTAALLHHFILPRVDVDGISGDRLARRLLAPLLALAVVAIVLAFLTRRPFFDTLDTAVPVDPAVTRISLSFDAPLESRSLRFEERPSLGIRVQALGFGWCLSSVDYRIAVERRGKELLIRIEARRDGYFSEFNQRVAVRAPSRFRGRLLLQAPGRAAPR
jgi:membrane-associated PAP2 superfamily phosphatase